MIGLLCFVLTVLASPFKLKSRLEAENAALRHKLIVLRRKARGRTQLTNNDHWFFRSALSFVPGDPSCSHNHTARHPLAFASRPLLRLFALHVAHFGVALTD